MEAAGMIQYGGSRVALAWHLSSNHYPPVPASMIPVCEQAIRLAADEEWDEQVELPEGISYRGSSTAPVWAIVEQHHLGDFVEACHQDDDEVLCADCHDPEPSEGWAEEAPNFRLCHDCSGARADDDSREEA